ncbi:MAG: hypothetical protein VE99_C0001G0145 [candidate division Kazan bacterium GW2011_GWC1_52_13]|uniref:Uncharacterized protein n=1 Tax=candidate division Kazan bacterium GW2011_GWB1_52_7 TaxID=1620414 RepID=A0A0G2A3N2_UNCK3|nr:MAG: hypothetical protein VE99_C0001G0145 [candidate division Kazan bacterium GW2011_GWC1_52_13]KKW26814.1 MAG: hypothetical protein VF00_C0002G0139 [candidate division Kazan bacterium GW2011_GWB1_52_7]
MPPILVSLDCVSLSSPYAWRSLFVSPTHPKGTGDELKGSAYLFGGLGSLRRIVTGHCPRSIPPPFASSRPKPIGGPETAGQSQRRLAGKTVLVWERP